MSRIDIQVPASKSMSHRALICAGFAQGTSRLENVLESQDIARTKACLRALGVGLEEEDGSLLVQGNHGRPASGPVVLDVGESGTTCRLITAMAAAGHGAYTLFGRGRMHQRSILPLARVLERLGSSLDWLGPKGFLPCRLQACGLSGGRVEVSLQDSSQYLSGLLLASPLAEQALDIGVEGEQAVSWPYVALTLEVMQAFGQSAGPQVAKGQVWQDLGLEGLGSVEPKRVRFQCLPGAYRARRFRVEGDWSNASYFLAAGSLGPKPVRLHGLDPGSSQGDRVMLDIVEAFGAQVRWDHEVLEVGPGTLQGIDLDLGNSPDLVPTVAVLASLSRGPTRIRNIAHLKLKESDRLQAVAIELTKAGARVEVQADSLKIWPGRRPTKTVHFASYNDHRLAMALAGYQLVGLPLEIDEPGCVAKSFPGFWDQWTTLVQAMEQSS